MPETVRLLVRPKRDLLVSGMLSVLLVMIPIFGVLYWFAADHDAILTVLVGHVIVLLAAIALLARQLTVHTVVTAEEIRGRGIFSRMVRVPLDRIASVHLVPTFVGHHPEAVLQLLVRDETGRRLYRMRANFWSPGDLERVAAHLPVPVEVGSEPLTLREFFAAYPGAAYWFENRPWLVGALVIATGAAGWWLGIVVMRIVGLPLAF